MAKRLVKWTLAGAVLRISDAEDEKAFREFRLKSLFPEWDEMTEPQRYIVVYGVKQALADAGASDESASDKVFAAFARWENILAGEFRSQPSAGTKLEKAVSALRGAQEKLELFRSLPPEQQSLADSLGVGEKALESAVARAKKALEKLQAE